MVLVGCGNPSVNGSRSILIAVNVAVSPDASFQKLCFCGESRKKRAGVSLFIIFFELVLQVIPNLLEVIHFVLL